MLKAKLALLSLVLFTAPVLAQTQIKIATIVPRSTSWGAKIEAARNEIKERTAGRVVLKVYYGGVQGSPAKIKQKIKIGQLHGGDFTPTDFQDKLPDLNVYGLPFVFESLDEVKYVRSRMDESLAAGFDKEGFVTFGFAGDFAIILSNTPVRNLDDMKGRKVWLPEGDAISDRAMKRLQLVPNSKPLSDVMTGLKTGLFDVVAVPPAAAVALQWHTAVDYFTDVPVIYAMQFLAISKRQFNKLTGDDQGVLREVLTRIYAEIDEQSPIDAIAAKQSLANNGIQTVQPDAGEFESIRKVMNENNRDMAKAGMFSLEVLEQMENFLREFRSNRTSETAAANGSL